MPDDIPVAGAAGRVTTAPTDEQGSDTQRRSWEIYYAVVAAANAVMFLLIPASVPASHRWLALGLLGAMVGWYLLVGRRVIAESGEAWPGWVFQVVLLVLFVGSTSVAASSVTILLFALCPLAYMSVRLRLAHTLVVVYAFTPAVVLVVQEGLATLPLTLTIGVVSTTVAVVIAETSVRTERISRERAALIRQLEASQAEVTRLSREAGVAEERQRLAGDIHDTVAQGLSSVVMLIEAAEAALHRDPESAGQHLRLAARTARESLNETRAIVAALTPAQLDGAPLADALRRLGDRFVAETGIAAMMSTVGKARPLATGTEVVLLRVVQEALNNVRKHAGATSVRVELAMEDSAARVRVSDDGVGFDAPGGAGYGLEMMRHRVEQIGGTLAVISAPGRGTTIETEVPA